LRTHLFHIVQDNLLGCPEENEPQISNVILFIILLKTKFSCGSAVPSLSGAAFTLSFFLSAMFVVDVVGVLARCDEGLVCCDESSRAAAEKSENNFKFWNVLIRGSNSTYGELRWVEQLQTH
jgi:hypothetical protein